MSYGGSSGGSGALSSQSDVALNGPVDGQVLGYNGSVAKWQNVAQSALQGPAGPVGLNWRGAFSASTTYGINDAASYTTGGLTASYINVVGSTGTTPPSPASGTSNATWGLLASPGSTGASSTGTLVSPIASGEETISRLMINQNNAALTSGTMVIVYFTATKTETVTKLITSTGTAAAGTTLARMGVYAADRSTGNLTSLLASTASSASQWTSAYQPPAAAVNNVGTLTSSWSKVAGTDYAFGMLFVGTTAPNLVGSLVAAGGGDGALAPRISGKIPGLSDLPSSATSVAIHGYALYVATATS